LSPENRKEFKATPVLKKMSAPSGSIRRRSQKPAVLNRSPGRMFLYSTPSNVGMSWIGSAGMSAVYRCDRCGPFRPAERIGTVATEAGRFFKRSGERLRAAAGPGKLNFGFEMSSTPIEES